MKTRWTSKLRELHADQSGAVAFLVLAGILISLMMALVIYDTTPAARQKLEVQGAADVAAYSQSAVEARSMNMIAFANIGKRIVIGQTLFYESLWVAFGILLTIVVVAAVAACVAAFFTGGALAKLCEFLVKTAVEIGLIMADEAEDLMSFWKRIKDYAKADVQAFDDYQTYFQALTPWWSWSEQFIRGVRNGAGATSGWPVPRNFTSSLPKSDLPIVGPLTCGIDDSLPIQRYPNWGELCVRSFVPDLIAHEIDYALQIATCSKCTKDKVAMKGTRAVVFVIVGLMAAGIYGVNCLTEYAGSAGFVTATFGKDTYPFQLKEPGSQAKWLQMSSNLVFAYRPGREFSTDFRSKYGFLSPDYESNLDAIYRADGYMGIARSEISYQDGAPDMWHTAWSARMRPVAFPGEWKGYGGTRLSSAFLDTVPYLIASAALGKALDSLLDGVINMGEPAIEDLAKALLAVSGMNNDSIEGVAR